MSQGLEYPGELEAARELLRDWKDGQGDGMFRSLPPVRRGAWGGGGFARKMARWAKKGNGANK